MDLADIHAWLESPTSIAVLPAGTTRGQALAALIHGQLADRDPWRQDRAWVMELTRDLADFDPRLATHTTPERIRSAIAVVLSATLCGGLSVPTR